MQTMSAASGGQLERNSLYWVAGEGREGEGSGGERRKRGWERRGGEGRNPQNDALITQTHINISGKYIFHTSVCLPVFKTQAFPRN